MSHDILAGSTARTWRHNRCITASLLATSVIVLAGCRNDCSEGQGAYSANNGAFPGCEDGSGSGDSSGANPSEPMNPCGNGALDPGEDCDGTLLGDKTCTRADSKYTGGELSCTDSCTLDTSQCTWCGDGITNGNESCESNDLAGQDCVSQGFAGGTLKCSADCTAFDASSCVSAVCSNGVRETGEQCDCGQSMICTVAQLGGAMLDCTSLQAPAGGNYSGGLLKCDSMSCTYDVSACEYCGDGVPNGGEACDDGNMMNTDMCTSACELPVCGDTFVQAGEQCDDGNLEKGDGCDDGCKHEYVMFVTAGEHPADFGKGGEGIAGADKICAAAAGSAGLLGTYLAWVSSDGKDAKDRLPAGKPLVRRDGATIVANSSDLVEGDTTMLMNKINVSEAKGSVTGYAWTGTSKTGTSTGVNCVGWTYNMDDEGGNVGSPGLADKKWTSITPPVNDAGKGLCNATNHLYCFRQLEP